MPDSEQFLCSSILFLFDRKQTPLAELLFHRTYPGIKKRAGLFCTAANSLFSYSVCTTRLIPWSSGSLLIRKPKDFISSSIL
jgi:hypothetical protein